MTEPTAARERGVSGERAPQRLAGHMNTFKLVLAVLAFSSPLTSMAGYFSLTIGVNGVTAPLAFLFVTLALLIFTVGYMAMTNRMRRPGAYYAYITAGLGRPAGLGSAYVATLSYLAILAGVFCFVGIVIQGLVTRFAGADIPWWTGTVVCIALIAVLGYFNIDVSVRVLVWVMLLEVVLVLVFDLAVLGKGGAEGVTTGSFDLGGFTGPEVWVGFLFAILVFIGFEATVLYRDEVKNPDRTIPRATYISVIVIGALYVFSVWMLVTAFGDNAQEFANANLADMFTIGASRFVGDWFADVVNVLLVTAVVASLLSIHNAATRYIFNLGSDGGLPEVLGEVHPRFRSPFRASAMSTVVSVIIVVTLVIAGTDPGPTYAALAGLGSTGIIVLMVLVSISVIVWFRRHPRESGENLWKTAVAPVLASLFLIALTGYAVTNYELVVGGEPGQLDWLLIVLAAIFAAGLVVAPALRARRPDRYARLGGYDRDADTTADHTTI